MQFCNCDIHLNRKYKLSTGYWAGKHILGLISGTEWGSFRLGSINFSWVLVFWPQGSRWLILAGLHPLRTKNKEKRSRLPLEGSCDLLTKSYSSWGFTSFHVGANVRKIFFFSIFFENLLRHVLETLGNFIILYCIPGGEVGRGVLKFCQFVNFFWIFVIFHKISNIYISFPKFL